MKVIQNTLKPEIERWDDPGDYPSGAGGGPLPSHNFVAGIDGILEVELDDAEFMELVNYADVGVTWFQMLEMYFNDQDRVGTLHDVGGLTVKKWSIEKHDDGRHATLSVEEFEMEAPDDGPDESDYRDEED